MKITDRGPSTREGREENKTKRSGVCLVFYITNGREISMGEPGAEGQLD